MLVLRGSLSPGGSIKVVGAGFTPASSGAILWDTTLVIGKLTTNAKGTFTANATIPPRAPAGRHAIEVAYEPLVAGADPAASVSVMLSEDTTNPGPTAAPTVAPAPTATPNPTTAPTPTAAPAPTPNTTPRPTPVPTPDPTPPPDPDPSITRPFAGPVTTATYSVPASIDASGATDASAALNGWTKTVPDGSVISFPAGGTFRMNKGLLFAGRNNIVLKGHGATFLMKGAGSDEAAAAFVLRGSDHIAITNFTVVGNNPNTSSIFVSGNENGHVLALSGWYGGPASHYVEISNVTASHVYADGAYLEGRNGGVREPSRHVWIHDNDWSYMGRNAISSINVTDLLVEGNHFDNIGGAAWDIEPNFVSEQVKDNTFRQNTVGSFGHMPQFVAWFVVSYNVGSSPLDRLVVSGNVVAGNPHSGYDATPRGLNSKFVSPATNVVFKNNTTTRAVAGPAVLYFAHIDGVTVTGNQQPLTTSTLAAFSDCTGVVYP